MNSTDSAPPTPSAMPLADHSTPGLLTVSSLPRFGSTPAGKAAIKCHFFKAWNGQYVWRQREVPKDSQPKSSCLATGIADRHCLFRRAVRCYQRTPKYHFISNIQCHFFTEFFSHLRPHIYLKRQMLVF